MKIEEASEVWMESELNGLAKTSKDYSRVYDKKGYDEYRKVWEFPNGYGISVIRGYGTYGFEQGLFEIALLKDGFLIYDDGDFRDVIGFLSPIKVVKYAEKICRKVKI